MTEDLERRLRSRLHEELPPAPAATRAFLARLPVDQPRIVARRGAGRTAVTAVLVGVGLVALASMAGLGGSPQPSDNVVAPPTTALPSPTGTPPPSSSADTFDGLTIHSVSELLDLRSDGRIGGERVALRGFWSDRNIGGSCVLPDSTPGELEIQCVAEFGITERNEPFGTVTHPGGGTRFEPTDGPALTPFVEEALAERLFSLPRINGQYYPPVPIVVVGHFDDPRAEDCRPRFRQRCRDRLVLDEILEFRPDAVPTPGITPSPSPFPFDDPPPAPFTKADCAGDVPYSFIGWGSGSDYGIDLPSGRVVFMMITRDEVRLSGTVARWVCWAYEGATVFQVPPFPDGSDTRFPVRSGP